MYKISVSEQSISSYIREWLIKLSVAPLANGQNYIAPPEMSSIVDRFIVLDIFNYWELCNKVMEK